MNPDTGQFWIIDFRIYDPDGDGQSKIEHVEEMLKGVAFQKKLPFKNVLMDSWYAKKNACCMAVCVTLKDYPYKVKKTIYQLKKGLLRNYLINELKNPKVRVCLA